MAKIDEVYELMLDTNQKVGRVLAQQEANEKAIDDLKVEHKDLEAKHHELKSEHDSLKGKVVLVSAAIGSGFTIIGNFFYNLFTKHN